MSKVELRSVFEIITLDDELWYGYYECMVKTYSYWDLTPLDCIYFEITPKYTVHPTRLT